MQKGDVLYVVAGEANAALLISASLNSLLCLSIYDSFISSNVDEATAEYQTVASLKPHLGLKKFL